MNKGLVEKDFLIYSNDLVLSGITNGYDDARSLLHQIEKNISSGLVGPNPKPERVEFLKYHAFIITGFQGANLEDTLRELAECCKSGVFSDDQLVQLAKLSIAYERDRNKSNIDKTKTEIVKLYNKHRVLPEDSKRLWEAMNDVV